MREICLVNAPIGDTPLDQEAKYIVGSPSLATGISFTTPIDLFVLVTEDSIFQPQDLSNTLPEYVSQRTQSSL